MYAACGRCGHFWDWHGQADDGSCKGGYLVGLEVAPCLCREQRGGSAHHVVEGEAVTLTYIVGQSYHNRYWRKDYTVLSADDCTVTVQWEDGKTVTHMTELDPLDIPFQGSCPLPDSRHGDCIRNRGNQWGWA